MKLTQLILIILNVFVGMVLGQPELVRVSNDTDQVFAISSIGCVVDGKTLYLYLGTVQPGKLSQAYEIPKNTSALSLRGVKKTEIVACNIVYNQKETNDEILELRLSDLKTIRVPVDRSSMTRVSIAILHVAPSFFFDPNASSLDFNRLPLEGLAVTSLLSGVEVPEEINKGSLAVIYALGYEYGIICRSIRLPKVQREDVLRLTEPYWTHKTNKLSDPFKANSEPDGEIRTEVYSTFTSGFGKAHK